MKSWWKSKSIWVGALQIVSSMALIVVEILNEGSLKVDMGQTLLMVNGVAMIILRWVTDKPINSPVAVMDRMRPRIAKNQKAKRYIVR
tara:strand:+ start:291 stop:554 length:264 start_codon:yes stop_codon:yes gene_type:complete